MRLPNLPSEDRLKYLKLLAEVLLLVLLVPLIYWAVMRHPHDASDRAMAIGRVP